MDGTQEQNGKANGYSNGHAKASGNGHSSDPSAVSSDNGHTNTEIPASRMGTMAKLFHMMGSKVNNTDLSNKVTIVGTGQVGMAAAFSLLTQNVTNNICLIDVDEEKVKGEQMDLLHGAAFLRYVNITAGTDYSMSAGSSICVVTAGVRQKVGESRLDLAQRNIDILKTMIPQLVKYSPDTILLLASNPVDILTYASWKISKLPMSRVIGSGCMVDSARYRYLLAEKLGVAPAAVNAYIIGEHGDSSVPIWSGVNVGGVRLAELNPKIGTECDAENFKSIHKEVIQSAYTIIKAKGYTSWAIGLCLAQICEKILFNSNSVLPVSTSMKGHYGIGTDVFLSMPCVLGRGGITDVIKVPLNKSEQDSLVRSAALMDKAQNGIKF